MQHKIQYGSLYNVMAYCTHVHGIFVTEQLSIIAVDDASRQATAMAILVACMKCTSSEKDTNPLCYLYQEYKVNRG